MCPDEDGTDNLVFSSISASASYVHKMRKQLSTQVHVMVR